MSKTISEKNFIHVQVKNKGTHQIEAGIALGDFAVGLKSENGSPIVAGIINNRLLDLSYPLDRDCELELVDLHSQTGLKIYRRSTVYLLLKACKDLFPQRRLMIKHTLSNGTYCEFIDETVNNVEVEQITRRMQEIIAADLPIIRKRIAKKEARELFDRQDKPDTVKILENRDKEEVHIYELDGFYEYFYGYMVNHTGILDKFKLLYYPPGMILQTPEPNDPELDQPFHEQSKLFQIYQEAKAWAGMLNTPHLGALNDIIEDGQIEDLIRVNEALQEKKIAQIADMIVNNPAVRLVLIAGPSSSGKTTFAQRLLIQLRVNGRRPVSISLDNYFVDQKLTPLDEDGEYDFEAIEALKLDLFNDHLIRLINGEEVEMPIYDFKKGCCLDKGINISVPAGEPIIIEGIHGLNDKLTWSIPREQKFKIYVSAITQINIDYANRIPTTDCRLIRRIIRDSRTRGYSALNTIKRWPSVRRGEEKYIFPFQENADIMFNSSLVYELAALKPLAEPLLREISNENREYVEARRLLKFLSYFRSISSQPIPPNSILREFVGGSWFDV
ncbi:MAG: nucleoside kinase [Syntrophomonadaceae bacterium]|nr:nucleoside kinase [Syntrophomonadaceae bacterium]